MFRALWLKVEWFFRERARRRKVRSILAQIGWVETRFELPDPIKKQVIEKLLERIRELETH